MAISPLVFLVSLSGIICVVSGELVRRRWSKPGATWFTIAAAACAVWAIGYGLGMLVDSAAARELFELPIWFGHGVAPVAFFLFVAAYTGQLESISETTVLLLWVLPIVTVGLVITNAAHGLMWTNYEVLPTAGAATTSYEKGPWLYVHKLYSYAILAAAAAILGEMIVDRDALYTTQAAALFAVVVPLGIASVTWVLELGPYPQLSLTPFLFGPVFAVGGVVLFRSSLFDSPPAARRIGRKRLLDDFGDGVLVIDDTRRIVEANDAARTLFDRETVLDVPIDEVLGGTIEVTPGRQQARLETPGGKQPYEVTVSQVTDETGNELGHSIVLQDISEETRRRQQLAVLNRVLRHNLRNDMTVIQGYARQLADETDGHQAEMADTAAKQAGDLIELGEKARSIEQVLDELPTETVDLRTVVEGVCSSYPDAAITVDLPPDVTVETQPGTLRAVLDAIVENAVVHTDSDQPTVEVTAAVAEDWVTVSIADDGPGIPEHELTPINAGTETELEHGSGLGLWLIAWGTDRLGGEVTFETPQSGGTTVALRLPTTLETDTGE